MKSRLQDRSVQTSCKNCIFAVYDKNTQTGCSANRLDKFVGSIIEAYDNDKEFYVINQFCNFYRNSEWNDGNPNLDKVRSEAEITFDAYINISDLNKELQGKIENFISSLSYSKVKINFFHSLNVPQDTKDFALRIYKKNKDIRISVCLDTDLFLHESILKSSQSFAIVLDNMSNYDPEIFNVIDKAINDDLKKMIFIDCNNTYSLSNIAYKMHFLNNNNNDYKENIEAIISKSKELSLFFRI